MSLKARGNLVGMGTARPIDVDGRAPAVLALHGFGGTPLEVELVVEVARELGLRAHAPLLPGHGTHARELASSTWTDWCGAVQEAFDRLAAGAPILLAGLSLGSLLAVHVARTHPARVQALALLGNAAWLRAPFPRWALEAIRALRIPDFWMPKAGADIADPEARRTHLTYDVQPVHAAFEVLDAGKRARAELTNVTCPTLLVHGARDRVCPASNARRAAALLGTSDQRVVILPRSRHIVTRDVDRDELRGELTRFFSRFVDSELAPDRPRPG